MLIYAIEAKDDDLVKKLLKRMPQELWLSHYLISALIHYDCKRSLDYVRSVALETVKNHIPQKIDQKQQPLLPATNSLNIKCNELYQLSKQQAPYEAIAAQSPEYKLLLTGENIDPLHFLRASYIDFVLQNFPSANSSIEKFVTLAKEANCEFSPGEIVDEALTEFMLKIFGPLQVTLPEKFRNYFTKNLFNMPLAFSNCYDVFLFPFSHTINPDAFSPVITPVTLSAAANASIGFFKFNRTLKIAMKDYQADYLYQLDNKKRMFIIEQFVKWLDAMEKKHRLGITYKDTTDLEKIVARMDDETFLKKFNFNYIKKSFLAVANACYAMMSTPTPDQYKKMFDKAEAIYVATREKNNAFYIKSVEGESLEKSAPTASKKKLYKQKLKTRKKAQALLVKCGNKENVKYDCVEPNINRPVTEPTLSTAQCMDDHEDADVRRIVVEEIPNSFLLFGRKQGMNLPLEQHSKVGNNDIKTSNDREYTEHTEKNPLYPEEVYALCRNKECFELNPQYYLEGLFSFYKFNMKETPQMFLAFQHVKPFLDTVLYQVNRKTLRRQVNMFIDEFGGLEAAKIFSRCGVIGALIRLEIIPGKLPIPEEEKIKLKVEEEIPVALPKINS